MSIAMQFLKRMSLDNFLDASQGQGDKQISALGSQLRAVYNSFGSNVARPILSMVLSNLMGSTDTRQRLAGLASSSDGIQQQRLANIRRAMFGSTDSEVSQWFGKCIFHYI